MSQKLVDCLIGLQWGSEGKGKIASHLSKEYNGLVRSGGPQAGHTFFIGDVKYINRQIPCGINNLNCKFYLSANSIINLEVLNDEIMRYGLTPAQLMIDNNALVVSPEHIHSEANSSLKERLASTLEGVGAAQSEKIWRRAKLFGNNSWNNFRECFAYDLPELYFFAGNTSESINQQIEIGGSVLLEGTQGFGLCLNHGSYPFVTSRDINSSSLLSDAGISPKFHRQTLGVMRTYPIRVGGNSGPTGSDEISWEEITKRSRSKKPISEFTTVTKRKRRVFEQDLSILWKAIEINQPDQIALMFLDYINTEDYGKQNVHELSQESQDYVFRLEKALEVPITLIGTGPKEEHLIDLRTPEQKMIPLHDISSQLNEFPNNFMGYEWNSSNFKRFIGRKMSNSA